MTERASIEVPVVDPRNAEVGKVTLPAAFSEQVRDGLLFEQVLSQRASKRSGTAATKTRAEVRGGGKKPWKQKGTGRARAGMTSSPIWRGGGITFPNSPDENFSHKVNRKMYRAGMASILSQLVRENRLAVVDGLAVDAPKTRLFAQKIKGLGLTGTVLIVTDKLDDNLFLASRNLPDVLVLETREVDPLSLVRFENIVLTKAAVSQFEEMLG